MLHHKLVKFIGLHLRSYKMYKLIKNAEVVKRLSDNAHIPFDPANMDYVDYLKWVAEGNTPLPAEDTP